MTVDEARAALLRSVTGRCIAPDCPSQHEGNGLDCIVHAAQRLEAAIEANVTLAAKVSEAAQELAALRKAAQGLVNALGARVPGLTRQQWVAVDALRAALAATPAEDPWKPL